MITGNQNTAIKKTVHLYRDCLRLVKHVAPGNSPKSLNLRNLLRIEFKKNAEVTDAETIEILKSNAIRGLANYLFIQSALKDSRLQQKSSEYMNNETLILNSNIPASLKENVSTNKKFN